MLANIASEKLILLNLQHWIDWVVYALVEKWYPVTVFMDIGKVFDTLDHKNFTEQMTLLRNQSHPLTG